MAFCAHSAGRPTARDVCASMQVAVVPRAFCELAFLVRRRGLDVTDGNRWRLRSSSPAALALGHRQTYRLRADCVP
jgi:hypothetical protein